MKENVSQWLNCILIIVYLTLTILNDWTTEDNTVKAKKLRKNLTKLNC